MGVLEQDSGGSDRFSNDRTVLGNGAGDLQVVGRLIEDVVESYKSSARSLWKCAEITWQLFQEHGMYEQQFTASLCDRLSVNKDTIYHWRKAWDLRQRVGYFDGLTISHYYHAADFQDKMEDDVLQEFLEAAADAKMSIRSFAHEIEMANNDSGTLPWLRRRLKTLLVKIESLYHSSESTGLSDYKRDRLKEAIKIIEEVVK